MKKILIITYYWPPSGGAGVQRWLKFSRYLPSTGWQPVILTIDPKYAAYPFIDDTLSGEVSPDIKVIRTKARNYFSIYSKDPSKIPSGGFANNPGRGLKNIIGRFIRGNFFIPDPRRGWNRDAVAKASELIREEGIKHIITTSPPHSTQLIGLRLKKLFPEIRWIADFRDTWTDIYYYDLFFPTPLARAIDRQYEKKVIQNADSIITVGNNLARTFESKARDIEKKMNIVPNGYDEEDFKDLNPIEPDRFIITYVGTLSEAYPLEGFLKALSQMDKGGIDFLLRFAGTIPDRIKNIINENLSASKTEFIAYSPHKEAVRLMAESSMLLLIIPDTEKNEAITPGKVFEYIATCKPVLYIGPENGDAAYHLRLCGQKGIFNSLNVMEIKEYISGEMKKTGHGLYVPHPEYSRRTLTQTLGKILNGTD